MQGKRSSSKNIHVFTWDFEAVIYLSEAQNLIPPPVSHCILVYKYTYSHRERGGGGRRRDEPERRLEGLQFTKVGRKYPD
jgi:hypothetical protein